MWAWCSSRRRAGQASATPRAEPVHVLPMVMTDMLSSVVSRTVGPSGPDCFFLNGPVLMDIYFSTYGITVQGADAMGYPPYGPPPPQPYYPPPQPYYAPPQPMYYPQHYPQQPAGPPTPMAKWVAVIGAIIGLIGVMMPWISVRVFIFKIHVSGIMIGFYGPAAFLCSILALVLILIAEPGRHAAALIAMIMELVVVIAPVAAFSTLSWDFSVYGLDEWVSSYIGAGIFVTIIGGIIGMIACGITFQAMSKQARPAQPPPAQQPQAQAPAPQPPQMPPAQGPPPPGQGPPYR